MDWFDWFFGKQMFCPSFPSNLVTRVFRSREPVLPCAATFQSPTDSHRFGWIGDEGKGQDLEVLRSWSCTWTFKGCPMEVP